MKKEKTIKIEIETCDVCGISFDEHKKKFPEDWGGTSCGFAGKKIKIIGWISICPTCLERKEKDWEWFEEIMKRKIEIKKLLKP